MKKNNSKPKRKVWFRCLKGIMKVFIKKTKFIYLGNKVTNNSIIVSNHVGTAAPLAMELYSGINMRFWGANEMNSGLIKLYKYQTKIYYHEKKGWNLGLARLFCLLASPLTNIFYKGLNLISTYKDSRLKNTIKESVSAIKDGQNIVIFPEDSTKGYLDELEGFHKGFLLLAEQCYKKGIDLEIFVSYFKKKDKIYIIDEPILYSKLIENGQTKDDIAKKLCERCNVLGKMNVDELLEKQVLDFKK